MRNRGRRRKWLRPGREGSTLWLVGYALRARSFIQTLAGQVFWGMLMQRGKQVHMLRQQRGQGSAVRGPQLRPRCFQCQRAAGR